MNNDTPPKQPGNIFDRFPRMRPVKNTPTLFTLNGFGVSVYGKRDFDVETTTYVKTHCVCFIFVPIFALGAYRVADAERGWYFIGKEPLSGFARNWNWCFSALCFLLALMATWNVYTSSPEYRAKQQLSEASRLMASGQCLRAASIYGQVAAGRASFPEARAGLQKSLECSLESASPHDVKTAFHILRSAPAPANKPAPLIPAAFERGLKLVDKFKGADPEGAIALFDEVATLEPKDATLPAARIDLLKRSIAKNPKNTNRVVELALVYESHHEMEECRAVLLPLKGQLGATEGARILGQLFLADGKHDDAYALLFPYVQGRLTQLRAVEKNYTNQVNAAYRRAMDFLREGHADASFYTAYKAAAKEKQDEMVNDFVNKEMQSDGGYQRALAELRSANKIVNVTLELGIVQLNRAQNLKDAAARKAELEAAEKTFLAIRGLAGETDEYRLFLGQVYYWLGKSSEGKQLFDELLASGKRSHSILMNLANTLRNVGEFAQCRELSEEAYRNGKNQAEKYEAAAFRALAQKDAEDEIAWLEKADVSQVHIQVSLDSARGTKALNDGNKVAAANYLRKAVEGYAKMQKTSSALNNGGLACMHLYEATGDMKDYQRGMALMEEAIALAPGDSILLMNTAGMLFDRALMDVVGNAINFQVLREVPTLHMLRHLVSDEAGRVEIYKQLHDNAALQKAMVYLDKAILLSPKSSSLYEWQLEIQKGFREMTEIQRLRQRLQTAALDTTEMKKTWQEVASGSKDKEYREKFLNQLHKYEALLKSPEIQPYPLTAEYVALTINNLKENAALYGAEVDAHQMLRDAQAMHEKHPDSATAGNLEYAYLYAAHAELLESNAAYAAMVKESHHGIAPQSLITLAIENGGPLSSVASKNPNVLKAAQMEKEYQARFPSLPHSSDWALLKTIDPEAAAKVVQVFAKNETVRTLAEVEWELEPLNATTVLSHYWILKMRGENQKAKEVYQAAVRDGIPLPTL